MKEHDIQKRIVKYLRIKGYITMCMDMAIGSIFLGKQQKKRMAFFSYIKGQGYQKGQPDLVAVKDKKVLFLELKTEKGKLSPEQAKLSSILPNYHIIRSIEDLQNIL